MLNPFNIRATDNAKMYQKSGLSWANDFNCAVCVLTSIISNTILRYTSYIPWLNENKWVYPAGAFALGPSMDQQRRQLCRSRTTCWLGRLCLLLLQLSARIPGMMPTNIVMQNMRMVKASQLFIK